MSLKIYAPLLTFATKHGRYLRKMDKRGIGTLSFVRASSEPVMRGVPGWDPVELEGPEWLNGEKARDDPEAGQERGLRGGV